MILQKRIEYYERRIDYNIREAERLITSETLNSNPSQYLYLARGNLQRADELAQTYLEFGGKRAEQKREYVTENFQKLMQMHDDLKKQYGLE